MAIHSFISPGELSRQALLSYAGEPYIYEAESQNRTSITLYDTFDWRLYGSGYWLARTGEALVLRDARSGTPIDRLEVAEMPRFAWELPEGSLKDKIGPVLFVRALIPLVEAGFETSVYRLLDDRQKTIARLELNRFRVGASRSARTKAAAVSIVPLRGYARQARQAAKKLEAAGLAPGRATGVYPMLLAAVDRAPGDYSSKPDYRLDPEMRSDEAARIILSFLLSVIKANEDGVRRDIDTEFLHDFRVSIRRTRSALSQIKGVFPPAPVARYKSGFAYLGKLTNPLRDLDVYLLKEPLYREMLPDELKADIDPLFDLLRHKRVQAHRAVVRGLGTKKYAYILDGWSKFLDSPASEELTPSSPDRALEGDDPPGNPGPPNAGMPVLKLAKSRIRKRYRLVVRTGEEILQTGQDESLHMLRIECKKLRYLLEFFASLFPDEPMDVLVKQLKRLQDNLGDFNDLTVQQGYLLGVSAELPNEGEKSVRTLLAIGALVGELEARQRAVKESFAGAFTEFASPNNQALFAELFGK